MFKHVFEVPVWDKKYPGTDNSQKNFIHFFCKKHSVTLSSPLNQFIPLKPSYIHTYHFFAT